MNISEGVELQIRSKSIPLRLDDKERSLLALVEQALLVSEYTDHVDIIGGNKEDRIITQIKDISSILTGLLVAASFREGSEQIVNSKLKDNEEFFQSVFEIARRYKIMNPDKLRTEYGKMIYLLQDSNIESIKRSLGFTCVTSIKTVYSFLKDRDGMALLDDPILPVAVMVITSGNNKNKETLESEIKTKESAVSHLISTYTTEKNDRRRYHAHFKEHWR